MKRKCLPLCLALLFFIFSGCTSKTGIQPPIAVDETPHSEAPEAVLPKEASAPPTENPPAYTDYAMNLTINPALQEVSCVETISFKNVTIAPLDSLYLRVYANSYTKDAAHSPYLPAMRDAVFPNGLDYGRFEIQSLTVNNEPVSYSLSDTVLQIVPKLPIAVGDEIEIKLMFEAYIPQIAHYIGSNRQSMWFGNLFPTLAVFYGHGWDTEPYAPLGYSVYNDVANYALSIVLPKEYDVIAPGITSVTENGADRVVNINSRMIRNFSFAIAKEYQSESIKTKNGVTISLYSKSYNQKTRSRILQQAKDTLEFYTDKLGSYPYSSLLLMECGLADGLEIGFSQLVFLNPALSYEGDYNTFNSLPIGFQWIPGIIGVKPMEDGWLSEGLVHFLNAYQQNAALLKTEMNTYYNELAEAYRQQEAVPPLAAPLQTYQSLEQYRTFYQKRSTLLIYQLYSQMGEAAFFEALRTFYARYAFQFASAASFQTICEETAKKDLSPLFDAWITQEALPPLL